MTDESVVFKGSKDGLHLIINGEKELDLVKERINEKIASGKTFFQDIKKIRLKEDNLTKEDVITLTKWLKDNYDIQVDNRTNWDYIKVSKDIDNINKTIDQGNTKFIYNTLRSGSSIKYNGNIVIVGDVNPGAEIKATGNIIVMGTLRGIAHAGALGNNLAIVVAFSLEPTQLRISDIIARSPDHQDFKPTGPEKACINENNIIVLPYYQNL